MQSLLWQTGLCSQGSAIYVLQSKPCDRVSGSRPCTCWPAIEALNSKLCPEALRSGLCTPCSAIEVLETSLWNRASGTEAPQSTACNRSSASEAVLQNLLQMGSRELTQTELHKMIVFGPMVFGRFKTLRRDFEPLASGSFKTLRRAFGPLANGSF